MKYANEVYGKRDGMHVVLWSWSGDWDFGETLSKASKLIHQA